jgi:hypothetical protein
VGGRLREEAKKVGPPLSPSTAQALARIDAALLLAATA